MPAANHQTPGENPLLWVKADLHIHTSEDPFDEVDYSALELVERAHKLGFRVLAVTLHEAVLNDPVAFARARELGILLIPAAELRIEGADAVVLNLSSEEAAAVRTFDDLRSLRARRGGSLFVFAPHPFYRAGGSIGQRIEQHLDCFDAIEHCHFHLPLINPNRSAAALARRTGKPLLATSDCHQSRLFGTHFSWLGLPVDQQEHIPAVQDVFAAIRADHIRRVAPKGSLGRLLSLLWFIFVLHPFLCRLPGSKKSRLRAMERARRKRGSASSEAFAEELTA